MARSGGFEPPTAWFVARYSIQLSYERVSWGAHYSNKTETVNYYFTRSAEQKTWRRERDSNPR